MAVRSSLQGKSRRRGGLSFSGVLVLALAIVAAAAILSRAQAPIAAATQTSYVAQYDTLSLPVPTESVPAGTRVRDIKLVSMSFPRHQVPEGALESVDGVLEAVTVAPLPAKLPLFRDNFSLTAGGRNPVVERIPPGMRAMTIRVDATSSVEGWAGSGSVVDVLLVEKDKTTVVAEKVKILSAERSVSPVEGAASPNVPSTVTLLVTQEQCLAINTAIPLGKIAFALRSNKDENSWDRTQYTSDKLKGGTSSSVPQEPVKGYVSIAGADEKKAFALTGGRWTPTDVVPQGFLVGKDR